MHNRLACKPITGNGARAHVLERACVASIVWSSRAHTTREIDYLPIRIHLTLRSIADPLLSSPRASQPGYFETKRDGNCTWSGGLVTLIVVVAVVVVVPRVIMPSRPLVASSPPPSPRSTTSSLTTPSSMMMNGGHLSPRTLATINDRNKSPRRRILNISPSRERPPTGRVVTRRSPNGSRIPSPQQHSNSSGSAERRDPWEEEEEEEQPTTQLIEYIRKRDWKGVASHIRTRDGCEEASQQLPSGDYPLHILCQSEYKSSTQTPSRRPGNSPTASNKDRPPHSLLVEVLQVFPEAVKTPNQYGSLPLHYAVQNAYPAAILHTLIRAYPQALDALDDRRWTPRDYLVTDDDPATRAILGRPTSCWLQQLRDEETQASMQNELRDLELEVETLIIELEASQREESHLEECIRAVEKKLHASSYLDESISTADGHQQLHDFIQRLAQDLQTELDELGDLLEIQSIQQLEKYERDEKERQYMASFNQDVERIYNNANAGLVELRDELERCQRAWG